MSKFISVKEAAYLIQDNQMVAILGSGGGVCEPTLILKEIGIRYQDTHKPNKSYPISL